MALNIQELLDIERQASQAGFISVEQRQRLQHAMNEGVGVARGEHPRHREGAIHLFETRNNLDGTSELSFDMIDDDEAADSCNVVEGSTRCSEDSDASGLEVHGQRIGGFGDGEAMNDLQHGNDENQDDDSNASTQVNKGSESIKTTSSATSNGNSDDVGNQELDAVDEAEVGALRHSLDLAGVGISERFRAHALRNPYEYLHQEMMLMDAQDFQDIEDHFETIHRNPPNSETSNEETNDPYN